MTRRLSIASATQENLDSRVYLGVHWRMDGNEGRDNGRAVGDLVAHTFPRRLGV